MNNKRALRVVGLAAVVSILVSACGDSDGVSPPTGPIDAPPAVASQASAVSTATPPPVPTSPPLLAGITLSAARGQAGTMVQVVATLATNGAPVTGAQNEITFDPVNAPIARKANGRPECTVNPEIDRESSGFTFFQPSGCAPDTCMAVRAIILSRGNTTPIPDGAVLYTCAVQLPPAVPPESVECYPLVLHDVTLSDANGGRVCAPNPEDEPCRILANGSACVDSASAPTPTGSVSSPLTQPSRTPTPTPTSAPAVTQSPRPAGPPGIQLGTMRAVPGQTGDDLLVATLGTGGANVAATQNDFSFDPVNARVPPGPNGRPHCTVNPAIDRPGTVFAFQPPGCSYTSCTAVRALVLVPLDEYPPIPDGAVLYTCQVEVAETAPVGTYPLSISNVMLSDSGGQAVCGFVTGNAPCTGNADGALIIGPPPTPTSTRGL